MPLRKNTTSKKKRTIELLYKSDSNCPGFTMKKFTIGNNSTIAFLPMSRFCFCNIYGLVENPFGLTKTGNLHQHCKKTSSRVLNIDAKQIGTTYYCICRDMSSSFHNSYSIGYYGNYSCCCHYDVLRKTEELHSTILLQIIEKRYIL